MPANKEKKELLVHREFLLGKGFSFNVNTNMHEHSGKIYYGIYNYFFIVDNEKIKIIIKIEIIY